MSSQLGGLGFEKIETALNDVFIIEKKIFSDARGEFVKTFNEQSFREMGLPTVFKESVYSVSTRHVLRGCHYQKAPFSQTKLVHVIEGAILDVIVGVGDNENRGKVFSVVLSKENTRSLYIPEGYAHGFLCLSDHAVVGYQMSSVYSVAHDAGVRYDSFGFEWPVENPITSERDRNLPAFDDI